MAGAASDSPPLTKMVSHELTTWNWSLVIWFLKDSKASQSALIVCLLLGDAITSGIMWRVIEKHNVETRYSKLIFVQEIRLREKYVVGLNLASFLKYIKRTNSFLFMMHTDSNRLFLFATFWLAIYYVTVASWLVEIVCLSRWLSIMCLFPFWHFWSNGCKPWHDKS